MALLLSSCNSFLDTKKEVITNTGNKINPNSKLGKEKIRQDNLLKKNIANEKIKKINEEKQKKIQEEYSKKSTEENLILAKATNEKNTDLCKTITIPDIKESCENNLIIIKAVDSNN
ncbi:TPA: hypothetical protein DEG21_03470 [Patescibacteria group bacterium]|nr:hypothetical protein [Candidatus Gracilibacteria bacterium]HBY74915.1 hypothetical protein [Candidatus Gracilibacteria bacterium]